MISSSCKDFKDWNIGFAAEFAVGQNNLFMICNVLLSESFIGSSS